MQNLGVPVAIVVAGAIIAGAIVFSNSGGQQVAQNNDTFGNSNSAQATNVKPIDETDHVLGGVDAKVAVIEYSDFECPFCARFHPTLEQVIEDFGGEVAWVYRHFPLTSIHPRATAAALASECVAEIGGNDAFWSFSNELFKNQRNLTEELYLQEAAKLGISEGDFISCVQSGRHQDKIQSDLDNAVASGGRGTPFTVIVSENGEVFPFAGALPYENVREVIEQALES